MEIPLLHRQFPGKFHPQIKNVRPWYTIGLIGNFSVLPAGNNLCISEFAKLRVLRPYVSSCLRTLRALLKRFIYTPRATFSNALHALFVCLKIFLG